MALTLFYVIVLFKALHCLADESINDLVACLNKRCNVAVSCQKLSVDTGLDGIKPAVCKSPVEVTAVAYELEHFNGIVIAQSLVADALVVKRHNSFVCFIVEGIHNDSGALCVLAGCGDG